MVSNCIDIPNIYQAILESMGEGIIVADAEGTLIFINRTAERLRGIKAANFIGRSILSIHSPHSAERIAKLLEALKDGSINTSRRVIDVRGRYFENSYYPIRHPDGGLYRGTLMISRDITEKRRLKEENLLLREKMSLGSAFEGFVGTSQAILQVFRTISTIASLDSTILITGESGTGKELVATAIQQHSKRRHKPMITVNCAALPEHLVESELFGHERGAFTGAVSNRRGKFEQANGGTILLDEIGDLPASAQAKLLRVIQEKTVARLGGERDIRVDVRIIAATNRDLQTLVELDLFRQDLYYRLNVITIHAPPLRERREDIVPLAEHFVRLFAEKMERPVKGLSEPAVRILAAYDYPGNVRELEHAMERGVALCCGDLLEPQDLPPHFLAARSANSSAIGQEDEQNALRPLSHSVGDFERQLVLDALLKAGGRKADAARLLNISRKTLWKKLKQIEAVETR
ncbi:sigma-54-dependent Fis family transcriptional regulator [Geobacter sp. SVR]|uniref:sigma-54 interaction domain-containing protein n=1 Tax=Geobacter sp. SVR TaxID=2495594 RepID=UPI0015656A3B|nr:sigma 54-interacting transcriptional regulator [Geobacter sp. SVR]